MEDGKKSAIRIWVCAMAFMGILLLWSRIASAAGPLRSPSDPDGWQTDPVIAALMQVIYDQTGTMPNDVFKRNVYQFGYNPQDNYNVVMYKDNSQLFLYIGSSENVYLTDNNTKVVVGNCNYAIWNFSSQTNGNNYIYGPYTFTLGSQYSWVGSYTDAIQLDDIYDFTIPNFAGTFENPIKDSITDPQICVGFTYSHGGGGRRRGNYTDPEPSSSPAPNRFLDYYVEIRGRFGICNQFNISGTGSFLNWYPINVDYTDYIDIYTSEDQKKVTDLGNNDFYLDLPDQIDEWTDLYNANVETIVFNWNANITTTGKNAQENKYKNYNMKLAGVQYNIADLYIRFVKIVDGQKHFGNWTHYVNSQIGTGTPPYNSVDDIPYVPSVDTSILDDDNVMDIIDNDGTDDTLLPSININTNFNVPQQNQLNYPTIVSFNHDSILTKIITTANQLPQFFEGFSNFLAAAFVFIDPSIWAIMGFGMMCSIVIMIIKVL